MDDFDALLKKIKHLCARCLLLHRENNKLRQELRKLRQANGEAKERLNRLIRRLDDSNKS